MNSKAYVWCISAVATLGGLLFGYDTAVISGATEFVQARFALSDVSLGWVVSSALAGCIVGTLFSGWFSDRYGRRAGLLFAAALFAVSAAGSAVPPNAWLLALARFVGGVGVGMAAMMTPIYIAEVAPAKIRGALVTLNQIAIVSGMVLSYLVNRYVVGLGDQAWGEAWGWRWMLGLELVPALLFFALTLLIPRSPRWLLKGKRDDEAIAVLRRVTDPANLKAVLADIREAIAAEEGKLRELFRPRARRITFMTMVLALFQAITGINIVMYYAPRIFLRAGIEAADAYTHSIYIGLVMVFTTGIAVLLVDRIGRKPLMIMASIGMGISLFLMGMAFPNAEGSGTLLLVYTLSYVSWFSIGLGGIYWVVVSEIFPNRIRGRAMSLSVVFLWGGNFLVAQTFPYLLTNMGEGVFALFGSMCIACLLFVIFFVPETRGRTLESIEEQYFLDSPLPHASSAKASTVSGAG